MKPETAVRVLGTIIKPKIKVSESHKKSHIISKTIFLGIQDLLADVILWPLVWAGATIALIKSGNIFLGWMSLLCGLAVIAKHVGNLK